MAKLFARHPALRYGVKYGLILGAVAVGASMLQSPAADMSGAPVCMLLLVEYTVALVLYFRAGKRAAAVTGEVGSGLVAGLLTGTLASVMGGVCTIALTLRFLGDLTLQGNLVMDEAVKTLGIQSMTITPTFILASRLADAILAIVISLLAGLALGAWGGAIGRHDAPPRPVPSMPPVAAGSPPAATPWAPPPPAGPPSAL